MRLQKNGKKCWKAVIQHRNIIYKIGHFYNEEEAAFAYDDKAILLFGENARLNFPKLSFEQRADMLMKIKGNK